MTMMPQSTSKRPAAEHPGDVVPTPDEFAGWPRLGVLTAALSIGPIRVDLQRLDRAALDSFERWAIPPGAEGLLAGPGWAGLGIELEFTRSDRAGYLALMPGQRTRLLTWSENGGLVMVTHGAALLMNDDGSRGIVVLARQLDPDLDLSLQNLLRVAASWRLAFAGRGLLLHGAAVEHGDAGILLLGPSGAGKTTALRLSTPRHALADDVVVLTAPRSAGGAWLVHPTPLWADPAFSSRTTRLSPLPMTGALRLHHASVASVAPMSRAAAAAVVLAHAPFLVASAAPRAAQLAESLVREVPFAALGFGVDGGFWPAVEAWLERPADEPRGLPEKPTDTDTDTDTGGHT